MKLNELTKPRLTDDRTYQQVKDIAEGHARAGRRPDIDQLRYIKLAECEMEEKDMNDEIEQAFRQGYCVGYDRGRMAHYAENLEDKHWDECRQIAHYDNELKCALKLLTEALGKVSTEWDEAAQALILAQRVKR
jgi:hypothetical protein